jgi:hypothetical protein
MSSNWERQEFRLPENHGWEAKPGNRIFVANQGALRFEIPNTWILEMPKGSRSFQFIDNKAPNDNIRLDARVMYLAATHPDVDWANLTPWNQPPITDWLKKNLANDERNPTNVSAPLTINVGDITIAWAEMDFIDPPTKRPAHTRLCYALKSSVALMALIAMDYWDDDADRARPVWNEVLGTLRMGEYVESPFHGPDR